MCQEKVHSESEVEVEEDENELDEEEYDNSPSIRAKWMLDGCSSIDEIIERLKDQIEHYKQLKEDGWELRDKIDDDWGFLIKKH